MVAKQNLCADVSIFEFGFSLIDGAEIKGGNLKRPRFLFTLGVFNLNYLCSGKTWSIKSKDSFKIVRISTFQNCLVF